MQIRDVICSVGQSGFFNTDFAASKAGAVRDGFLLLGEPMTPGFRRIIQPGVSISVMLLLQDGQVAFGDCVDVILSGIAGRDRLFQAEEHLPLLQTVVRDLLVGRDVDRFRPLAEEVDRFTVDGQRLHTAVRYGLTQAILHAVALSRRVPMAVLIGDEYYCALSSGLLKILASSPVGNANQLDRLIMRKVDLLPHSSFTNVARDIGLKGEILLSYARDVAGRITAIGEPGYRPTIHLDVYGTLAEMVGYQLDRLVAYIGTLKDAVAPYELMVESPIIMPTQPEQIRAYQELGAAIRAQRLDVQIIVDEWCNTLEDVKLFADEAAGDILQVKAPDLGGINNTIEAVLYARGRGRGVSLGGSLNETDQSSRITVHVGLACRPTYIFAKPGYGGDEGIMIQANEMARTLALIAARQ